jgi:hypothetical protein
MVACDFSVWSPEICVRKADCSLLLSKLIWTPISVPLPVKASLKTNVDGSLAIVATTQSISADRGQNAVDIKYGFIQSLRVQNLELIVWSSKMIKLQPPAKLAPSEEVIHQSS